MTLRRQKQKACVNFWCKRNFDIEVCGAVGQLKRVTIIDRYDLKIFFRQEDI